MYTQDSRRIIYCANCGEEGHIVRECDNPLTSFGLITFKTIYTKEQDEQDLNSELTRIVPTTEKQYPLVKFLMIQRKDTMGYIDFLRGKYPSDDILGRNRMTRKDIRKNYIDEMIDTERDNIKQKSFDEMWDLLWVNKNSRPYKNEKNSAYRHFKEFHSEALDVINSSVPKWFFSEFSFPKGRKQLRENNKKCAQREFQEETGYNDNDYRLVNCKPFEEHFIGTNCIPYTHIYYLSESDTNIRKPIVDQSDKVQIGEVKNIGWFTLDQALGLIRDYDHDKKKVLLQAYEYITHTR